MQIKLETIDLPRITDHPLYYLWKNMLARCGNPNATGYAYYGGRGIKVCERWKSFDCFVSDLGPRPEGMTLDRISSDGDYEPNNCRWASRKEQQRNQRVTAWVTIEGNRYKAADLAELSGLKADTIKKRAADGLSYAEVMSPARRHVSPGLDKARLVSSANRAARTHCHVGHEYTAENTGQQKGGRFCRNCFRISKARYKQRLLERMTSGQK